MNTRLLNLQVNALNCILYVLQLDRLHAWYEHFGFLTDCNGTKICSPQRSLRDYVLTYSTLITELMNGRNFLSGLLFNDKPTVYTRDGLGLLLGKIFVK